MSQLKIKNGNNWESIPAGGIGVPSGGTTGQFLKKSSSVDYATEWGEESPRKISVLQFSDFVTVNDYLEAGDLIFVNIPASVMNQITGESGSANGHGFCAKITTTVVDYLVMLGAQRLYKFRITITGGTPVASQKTQYSYTAG